MDKLMESNTILMLLLLTEDVLVHVNRFFSVLVNMKLNVCIAGAKNQQTDRIVATSGREQWTKLQWVCCPVYFTWKNVFSLQTLWCDILEEEVVQDCINHFHQQVKALFMIAIIKKLQNVIQMDNPMFLAFNVFNFKIKHFLQE